MRCEPSSLHDFGYSIIPGMVGQDRVYAYKFDGFWRDIGTIDAYYDYQYGAYRYETTV